MANGRPITIAGGGLAGLALGIGLRQRGIPVMIHEAGYYPRQRVCGEFISGRGLDVLSRLGLKSRLLEVGAVPARTVAFHSTRRSSPARELPAAALCLSRWQLDARLAEEFRRLGGELREGCRFEMDGCGEGVVRANGRRLAEAARGHGWFGLKIHARNVRLEADLEMHVSPLGYVGLCQIEKGEVNVCGLFHRRSHGSGWRQLVPPTDGQTSKTNDARQLLRGLAGSPLYERLAKAEFDERSFCSVAGISLEPAQAASRIEVCVGDALTMIPPVTGNGMSMAFESAELALEPLAAWSLGMQSWFETREEISRRCDERFARRLAWAKWLQRLMLTAPLQDSLVALAGGGNWLWRLAFANTR